MGPLSGVLFLVGLIMVFVGRNRNNDFIFSGRPIFNNDGESNRIQCLITGVFLIIIAVAMWVYLALNGEPGSLPDYSSMMNRNSSQ